MLTLIRAAIALSLLFAVSLSANAQSLDDSAGLTISPRYLQSVSSKAASLENKLDKRSQKALARLRKQEAKMKRKLAKIDSSATAKVLSDANQKYSELEQKLSGTLKAPYIAKLDSLATSIKFLQGNTQFISQTKEAKQKLDDALSKVKGLKDQLAKTEEVKKFLAERKKFLKEQLGKFGFAKELKKINKEAYYFAQQVSEYKEILKDSKKAEKKSLELLSKTKFFRDFMRKNSELASLFRLPGDPNDPSSQASLAGLQTRAQVNNLIQGQIASAGPGAAQQVSQNMQAAQAQLAELKDKVLKAGGNSADAELPEGFRPNSQRTKSFVQKWELNINIQTSRSNGIFPASSDVGLSAGFKPNDWFVAGLGIAGRIGWGKDIRHIAVSYSGLSARSFTELRLKGNLNAVAGFEMNYRPEIRNVEQLRDRSGWVQSGLAGASKTISARSGFFKKTKVALLWDFLSYRQPVKTAAVVMRIGYTF